MGLATVMALCLCGQIRYSSDDSLNQWESHLLEARWVLVDEATSTPRILLVFKCLTPDHRLFELYLYDRWDDEQVETVRAWTGTYKMESRENRDKSISEKLVRLNFDQHWVPVDGTKAIWIKDWMTRLGFVYWTRESDLIHWIEALQFLDWTEERDFKPFLAEFKIDGPTAAEPIPPENIKFLLRSNDVKRVGCWVIGTQYVLSPVKKWRRASTPVHLWSPAVPSILSKPEPVPSEP